LHLNLEKRRRQSQKGFSAIFQLSEEKSAMSEGEALTKKRGVLLSYM